jgi:predicted polyphosphate/ATP-dependent NAD kinase
MGESESIEVGFTPNVIGRLSYDKTTREDTVQALIGMQKENVDLIVFVGGDGTARDVCSTIDRKLPVLGVPSGVKTYSGVFALNPSAAAKISIKYLNGDLQLKEAEVVDIDEEEFKNGNFLVRIYGLMNIPYEPTFVQNMKVASPTFENEKENQTAIAKYLVEQMVPDTLYILGPGTTTKAIANFLGIQKTLLGVDIIENKEIRLMDVNEKTILDAIEGRKAKLIVSPLGQQGFIFGRGNQQISADVLKRIGKENIIILASISKLQNLRNLRIDTGNSMIDSSFQGYVRVICDYHEERVMKIE